MTNKTGNDRRNEVDCFLYQVDAVAMNNQKTAGVSNTFFVRNKEEER
jgi:hypothetical protein